MSLSLTCESHPVVSINTGAIRGRVMSSRLGRDFFAFRGIPYAEPPTGKLRFINPLPKQAWQGEFDATEDGPRCPQPSNEDDVSEDCLRVNVYTLNLTASRPVIVYLHPGGFYGVSGQSKNFAGPQSLMDRDVVLVTLNYRLGTLGFMSTGTADSPGNAGLKDQVLALRWVKDNIAVFGGDASQVTLLGYSAGALSISLHMISPMSRGLFHRAIVMSAAATAQWKIKEHQLYLAERQAQILGGCPNATATELVECIRTMPARVLGDSLPRMFEFEYNPILLWTPVIEKDFGQERFLTEDPTKVYLEGKFMKIPIISGITKDEFAGPATGKRICRLNLRLTFILTQLLRKIPQCWVN